MLLTARKHTETNRHRKKYCRDQIRFGDSIIRQVSLNNFLYSLTLYRQLIFWQIYVLAQAFLRHGNSGQYVPLRCQYAETSIELICLCLGMPRGTTLFPEVLTIFSLPDSLRNRIYHSPFPEVPEVPATIPCGPRKSMFMTFYLFFCAKIIPKRAQWKMNRK